MRRYTLMDVTLLLHISLLNEYGFRISDLHRLNEEDIHIRVLSLKANAAKQQLNVCRLIRTMFSGDVEAFEAVLDEAMMAWGIDITIASIILPFLEKVPILSYRDSSVEVHFAVTAVRKKLILGIERTGPVAADAKTVILFLPQGEHFDLMLLYMCYALKNAGLRVLYLGTDISLNNLKLVSKEKQPSLLYSYIASKQNFPMADYQLLLGDDLPGTTLVVAYADNNSSVSREAHHPKLRFVNYKHVALAAHP